MNITGGQLTHMYNRVQLLSTLKHNGISLATSYLYHCLCSCPAVFFHHLYLIALFYLWGQSWHMFQVFL